MGKLAEPTGLEPATSHVTGERSNQLNYGSAPESVVGNTGLSKFSKEFQGDILPISNELRRLTDLLLGEKQWNIPYCMRPTCTDG